MTEPGGSGSHIALAPAACLARISFHILMLTYEAEICEIPCLQAVSAQQLT